jgi:hypothetical protein
MLAFDGIGSRLRPHAGYIDRGVLARLDQADGTAGTPSM